MSNDPYEQFEREVAPPASDTPTMPLFHYTDAQGFIGIVKDGTVRASDCRYLNDGSEIESGYWPLRHTVLDLSQTTAEPFDSLFRALFKHLDGRPIHEWYHPYIASFSEDGNLLSQWRAYGGGGAGYSLGFKLGSQFEKPGLTARLVRCEYSEDAFRAQVRKELLEVSTKMEEHLRARHGDVQRLQGIALRAMMIRVSTLVPRFKHPAFREEREWRIAAFANSGREEIELTQLRARGGALVPYFEIPLGVEPQRMPLSHVYVGPTLDRDTALHPASLLLMKHGYTAMRLETAGIPYRTS